MRQITAFVRILLTALFRRSYFREKSAELKQLTAEAEWWTQHARQCNWEYMQALMSCSGFQIVEKAKRKRLIAEKRVREAVEAAESVYAELSGAGRGQKQ